MSIMNVGPRGKCFKVPEHVIYIGIKPLRSKRTNARFHFRILVDVKLHLNKAMGITDQEERICSETCELLDPHCK